MLNFLAFCNTINQTMTGIIKNNKGETFQVNLQLISNKKKNILGAQRKIAQINDIDEETETNLDENEDLIKDEELDEDSYDKDEFANVNDDNWQEEMNRELAETKAAEEEYNQYKNKRQELLKQRLEINNQLKNNNKNIEKSKKIYNKEKREDKRLLKRKPNTKINDNKVNTVEVNDTTKIEVNNTNKVNDTTKIEVNNTNKINDNKVNTVEVNNTNKVNRVNNTNKVNNNNNSNKVNSNTNRVNNNKTTKVNTVEVNNTNRVNRVNNTNKVNKKTTKKLNTSEQKNNIQIKKSTHI